MTASATYDPMISVVITSYNHARFIGQAIESVMTQTYAHHEIIVVNDGSTDDTENIVAGYGQVKYIYQENQGLPAARNTGVAHCRGEFLVFLDADDWLLPHALAVNAAILMARPELAFVAGAHTFYISKDDNYQPVVKSGGDNYYCRLLEGNFIAMHAAVMYRKWVFKEFRFDTALANCEDYDLYLQIVRKYPMFYHEEIISVYRLHETNMSGDARKMLDGALVVFKKHEAFLQDSREKSCLDRGRANFSAYYMEQLEKSFYLRLYHTHQEIDYDELAYLKSHEPAIFERFMAFNEAYILDHPEQLQIKGWRKLLPHKFLLKKI